MTRRVIRPFQRNPCPRSLLSSVQAALKSIHLLHESGLINEDDGLRHGPVTASFVTTSDGIGMELSGSCRDCMRGPALGGLIMTPSAATPDSTTSSHSLIESHRVEGTLVYDPTDKRIGTIHHLIIEKVSGQVVYV